MPINELNAKPRVMQWDEQAFVADLDVQRMSVLERWCYRTLLNKAYWCDTRPYLPDNDDELWFLAGCESKEQWLSVKKNVIRKFSRQKNGKKKVLAQKRLVEDWKIFISKLLKLQENGRLGGLAKAKLEPSVRQKEEVEVKDKDKREVEGKEEGADMSFKNNITDKARSILGVRIFAGDQGWDEMNSLKRVHGGARVEEVFEEWASSVQDESVQYPLTTFLRVADGLIAGRSHKASTVKPLILELSFMSDGAVTFNQKQSMEIARLAETYTVDEIKAAFREFVDGLDEFTTKFAAKDFSEKAEQLIYTQRKRKEQTENTNRQLETIMAEERKKAEAEYEALPPEIPFEKIEL